MITVNETHSERIEVTGSNVLVYTEFVSLNVLIQVLGTMELSVFKN